MRIKDVSRRASLHCSSSSGACRGLSRGVHFSSRSVNPITHRCLEGTGVTPPPRGTGEEESRDREA